MRAIQLFLYSRQAGRDLLILAGLATVTWAGQRVSAVVQPAMPPLLLLLPLFAAAVVGNRTSTPFGELEATASRPLAPLRLVHLLGLATFAALSLAAVSGWPDEGVIRNVAGLTGLAFLAARLVGAGMAWMAPMGYGIYSLGERPGVAWTWPVQAASDLEAAIIAALLLLAGLVAVVPAGAPNRWGELE